MTQPKKLTDQQRKFAELYVYNEGRMSPAEAAYAAGYKTRSRQVAAEMRNPKYFPLVVQYIGELRAEVQEKYGITLDKHVTELAKLRDDARNKGAWAAAINAEVARGKVGGLYVDQKMILTKNLDNMSEKELELKLKQIIDDHKTLLDPNAEVIESESSSLSMPEESSSDPQS